MLLLKLALIPASVWLASLAGRYFGHALAGVLSGLPMIAGPITALLLLDHDAATIAPVIRATVNVMPALLAYFVAYAWLARRWPWWACLPASALVFVAIGWPLSGELLPQPWPDLLALASPWLALALMPKVEPLRGPVSVPRGEIALRMLVAVMVGAAILYGAGHFSSRVNGLLLSWPVSGTILPSFTLPIHGPVATVNLLRGYANGLVGFAVYFCGLNLLLTAGLHKWLSFACAIGAAVLTAWITYRLRLRRH